MSVGLIGLNIQRPSQSAVDICGPLRPSAVVLIPPATELAERIRAASPETLIIGRVDYSIPKWPKGQDLEQLYNRAQVDAERDRLGGLWAGLDAVQVFNEPTWDVLDPAEIAAYHAGYAYVLAEAGLEMIDLNLADGNGELVWMGKYLRSRQELSSWGGKPIFALGHHGYLCPGHDTKYYSLRPWDYWTLGNTLPPVILTETGCDLHKSEPPSGYRGTWSSEVYAEALMGLTRNLSLRGCRAACIFLFGALDEDKWASFDIEGDEVVLRAICEWNAAHPMPSLKGGESEMNEIPDSPQDEAWLEDIYRRQGVELPKAEDNSFARYVRNEWMQKGRLIYPLPSPDGNFENHDHARFVFAYTVPPLFCERGTWSQIYEGNPFARNP